MRSIRGRIGIDFTRKGDGKLQDVIKRYLTHSDNVELLNILSREINDFNWFEAYNREFIDLDIHTKEELMGMENIVPMGHTTYAACSSGEENLASMIISGTGDDPLERKNSSRTSSTFSSPF